MPARILDGKGIADAVLADLRREVEAAAPRPPPSLALLRTVPTAAAEAYARQLARACERAGIAFAARVLPPDADEGRIVREIGACNGDPATSGIILQMPLPAGIDPALARLLAPNPRDRFWSAKELAAALEALAPIAG